MGSVLRCQSGRGLHRLLSEPPTTLRITPRTVRTPKLLRPLDEPGRFGRVTRASDLRNQHCDAMKEGSAVVACPIGASCYVGVWHSVPPPQDDCREESSDADDTGEWLSPSLATLASAVPPARCTSAGGTALPGPSVAGRPTITARRTIERPFTTPHSVGQI